MLNRYRNAALKLIEDRKRIPLVNITNKNGQAASWNDDWWKVLKSDGSSMCTPLHRMLEPGQYSTKERAQNLAFPDEYRQLIMCWILELRNTSNSNIYHSATAIRQFLGKVDLFALSQQSLNQVIENNKGKRWVALIPKLLTWLSSHNIVPSSLKGKNCTTAGRDSPDYIKEKAASKMPDERALYAFCAIKNEVIPSEAPKATYLPDLSQALVVSSCVLGLSSPQRAAMEQFVLPKCELQSKTVKKEGEKRKVYWIDWLGSKGFKANRKHFFQAAAKPVCEVLNFWNEAGEPARILCRFYENPNAPLKKLLGNYKPLKVGQYNLNKPINNMFVLGDLLGFYSQDKMVTIHPENVHENKPKTRIAIKDLTLNTRLSFGVNSHLIGVNGDNKNFKKLMTVAEFQELWIKHIKKNVPTFPYRLEGDNRVRLSDALFIGTGAQLTYKKGYYDLAKSFYAIETANMPKYVRSRLSSSRHFNIFKQHGFADDIRLTPYQLRHWGNTMMQKSDLSDVVIALVSGRRNANQNAVYDHETDEEKVTKVHRLFSDELSDEEMKNQIRVMGHEEYKRVTGKAATIMPTGACTQELSTSPCIYLNDFETHCALCSSSCHFAHDSEAISLLKHDLLVQKTRLNSVKGNNHLRIDVRLQSWFLNHHKRTSYLEQLIALMEREDLKIGVAIKFVSNKNVFTLTDLQSRTVTHIKANLPNSKAALDGILESTQPESTKSESAVELTNLLSSFGVEVTDL